MKKLLPILILIALASCTPEMVSRLEKMFKPDAIHILVIGDSQSGGGIRDSGTKIPDSTLFEWRKNHFVTGNYASGFYPLMAKEIKTKSYCNTYLFNAAQGGSSYASSDKTNRWGEGGFLYERLKNRTDTYIGQNQKFDFILLALGGLDALGSAEISEIKKQMIWVINKLEEDFPGTKILLSKAPGGDNYSEKMKAVRDIEDSIIKSNPNIYEAYDIGQLVDRYEVDELTADGLHLKQKYSDTVGRYNGRIINELLYAED